MQISLIRFDRSLGSLTFNLLALVFWVLLDSAEAQAAPVSELQAGKARLVQKLEANQMEQQKRIGELRAYIKKYGKSPAHAEDGQALRFSIEPQQILDEEIRHQQERRAFLELIKKEDAQHIPALLQTIFLSCDQGACQHQLDYSTAEELIATFGSHALRPLLQSFKTLDAPRKESTLNLLVRIEPLQCPTTVLDRALTDPVFRVRAASLNVYNRNCAADAFYQRLNQLLAWESDPESLIYLLDQVPDDGKQNSLIYNRLIQLVQEQRVPVAKAFGKLCSRMMTPAKLDASELNIPFWLGVFEGHQSRQSCLVENLFLKLDQEKHLVKLHGLFRAAAEHRYRFSAIRGLYGLVSPDQPAYWNAIPGSDVKMLDLFQTHLSQEAMMAWINAPYATFGEQLLLTQWVGGDLSRVVPSTLRLQLEVRSPSNAVVSSTIQNVRLGQPFHFTLTPYASEFQEIRYQGNVLFDADTLNYRIRNFIVGFKPAGAGFEPVIPLTGSFETDLLLRQKSYKWKINLVPASNSVLN